MAARAAAMRVKLLRHQVEYAGLPCMCIHVLDNYIHATIYHFVLILNVNDKFLCLALFLQQLHKVT